VEGGDLRAETGDLRAEGLRAEGGKRRLEPEAKP
jgi:hypothetical protein